MTMAEVRKHAHLDTQAVWDTLIHIEQLERHAHKCNYFGLGDNPAHPVAIWSTCRRTMNGECEDLEEYKAFLQEVVGFGVVAVAPSPVPPAAEGMLMEADSKAKRNFIKKFGKRAWEELEEEDEESLTQADGQGPSKKDKIWRNYNILHTAEAQPRILPLAKPKTR
jgi:hypothetical protein